MFQEGISFLKLGKNWILLCLGHLPSVSGSTCNTLFNFFSHFNLSNMFPTIFHRIGPPRIRGISVRKSMPSTGLRPEMDVPFGHLQASSNTNQVHSPIEVCLLRNHRWHPAEFDCSRPSPPTDAYWVSKTALIQSQIRSLSLTSTKNTSWNFHMSKTSNSLSPPFSRKKSSNHLCFPM